MKNLIYRMITSVVLLPIVIFAFWLGGYYLIALFCLASLIANYEACLIIDGKSTTAKVITPIFWLSLIASFFLSAQQAWLLLIPMLIIFNAAVLFNPSVTKEKFEKLCAIFYWCFYINMAFISMYRLLNSFDIDARTGLSFVFLVCIATWANDSFAFFCGRSFGKNPLFKTVSEKKTWEGFIGGGVLSVAFVLACKYLPQFFGFDWLIGLTMKDLLWISLPAIFLAPFGDLIESRFKRFYGAKDSSSILPGHGGLLDRIDGLLIVMPWAALYAFVIRPLYF